MLFPIVTLYELVEEHCLTNHQLNSRIGDDDIPLLAEYFSKVELYSGLMKLSEADKKNVTRTLHTDDTQTAMSKCLSLWKRRDPLKATYIALLEIILKLGAGETANNVGRYLAKNGKITVYSMACMCI